MQVEVTLRRRPTDGKTTADALIRLRLEALRWSRDFELPACNDVAAARAAARAYAWYFGYLLHTNAALVRAHATRSMVEHSREGGRTFMEIGLNDGAGACVETVTVGLRAGLDGNAAEEAGEILRKEGLAILTAFADAPGQAMSLLGGRPFYSLPRWTDRALEAARRSEMYALPGPRAVEQAAGGLSVESVVTLPALRAS